MNTAADFLSRAEINTEKLEMNIRNNVTTQAIEVNIQSTGVAEEETLYLLAEETPIEQQLCEEKKSLRKAAKVETHKDPENEVSELQRFHSRYNWLQRRSLQRQRENSLRTKQRSSTTQSST